MTIFGYTLRALRVAKGLSAKMLSDKVDLTIATLENLENGYIEPNAETAARLAEFFGVTVGYMKGSVEVQLVPCEDTDKGTVLSESPQRVIRLHPISSGSPDETEHVNQLSEAEEIILPLPSSDRSDYAAIRVPDHSMRAYRAEKDDILIVRQDPFRIRNGDLTLVAAEDGRYMLRRYFRDGGIITLRAEGEDDSEPIRIRLSDTRYRLLGTVVQIVIHVAPAFVPPRSEQIPVLETGKTPKTAPHSPYTYSFADNDV